MSSFDVCFQVFKKLHLGTVAFTPDTMDEVRLYDQNKLTILSTKPNFKAPNKGRL